MQTATIIKIGNSLGIRIKHEVIQELGLSPGDEVKVSLQPKPTGFHHKAFLQAVADAQAAGGVPSISNPAGWQREARRDRKLPGRQ